MWMPQFVEGSAPQELRHLETFHDIVEEAFANGNTTVQLPSMLLMLYELTMQAPWPPNPTALISFLLAQLCGASSDSMREYHLQTHLAS